MKQFKMLLLTVMFSTFTQAAPVNLAPIISYLLSGNTSTDILLPITYSTNEGRLLGSQCAQCHGTNGISSNDWDSIAGEDDLLDEIYQDDEPIMDAQAHGYTEDEIILIGNWLKTLSKNVK